MENKKLFYNSKNAFDVLTQEEIIACDSYCEKYKVFLNSAKTEREAVKLAVSLAMKSGFKPYDSGIPLRPGDKVFKTINSHSVMFAIIGQSPMENGVNIALAHIDSPRLDLKQIPLYEENEIAFFKTHYYGSIKKYQWVTIPLALHGVVAKKDGSVMDIIIGEDNSEPVFVITDLIPHLGKEQEKKTLGEAFAGEDLNMVIGSQPAVNKEGNDRIKGNVLEILNEKYGIDEEDFLSAEIEAVPAGHARDIGLDRSMIGAYGQDDRACAFAALSALLDCGIPETTAVCVLTDKEEIGSEGVSGIQSMAFDTFISNLCGGMELCAHCFENSFCLSADVCNAFDPNFSDVSDINNAAKVNRGLGVIKFSGHKGKSGANDSSAETVAMLRRVFSVNNVVWQMAEIGKVDQGGSGTMAKFMANRSIKTIDIGVPVLSMHAPFELASKLDCYMAYKGIRAILRGRVNNY